MRRVFFFFLVAAAALLAGGGQQAAAVNNQLQVDMDLDQSGIQSTRIVSPSSGPFYVGLWVNNVQTRLCTDFGISQPCGLGAYTIRLTFDQNIIRCKDGQPGTPGCQNVTNDTFLTSTGRLIQSCGAAFGNDPDNGVISYTCITSGNPLGGVTPLGPNGTSGLLAKLRFEPVPGAIGVRTLNISDTALSDITATPICAPYPWTPCDVQNGEVNVNYKADLRVTKSAPSPVAAPNTISYTLNVTNGGPDQAGGVSLVDTLPAEVGFSSASQGCNYDGSQHKVTCDLGTLTNGQNKTVNVTASVAVSQAGKTALNKVDVTTTSLDQTSSNNHAEASTQISPNSVSIAKTVPLSVNLNGPGQYRLDVTSTGPSAAGNVIVNDTLPSQVAFTGVNTTLGTCSYTAPTVSCNLGDMGAGASATVTINVTFGGAQAYVCNAAIALWSPLKTQSSDSKCTFVGYSDTDGDGCLDIIEEAYALDPLDEWDFYDVPVPAKCDVATGCPAGSQVGANGPRSRVVNMSDVLAVLFYVFTTEDGPPNANMVDYDTIKGVDLNGDTNDDTGLADPTKEGLKYDRSPGLPDPDGTGPLPDPAGEPNGVVNMSDVLAVLAQAFIVNCTKLPP